jgi:hypothetical protein
MQLRVKKAVDNQILNVIHAQLCYTLGPELMQRLKNNKKRLATLTGRSCNKNTK